MSYLLIDIGGYLNKTQNQIVAILICLCYAYKIFKK